MLANNKQGMAWTKEHNDVLRMWCEDGLTVREIREKCEETFQEPFTDPQIRAHLKFIGIEPNRERAVRRDRTTPEMREWIRERMNLPPSFLVSQFRARFGDAGRAVPPRIINAVAAKERYRVSMTRTEEEIVMDWERIRKRLSPRGNVARSHWLWRYMPIDENRTAGGVVFRER